MELMMLDKQANLAGPGVSTYDEVEKILAVGYHSLFSPLERMKALFEVKEYIEKKSLQGSQSDIGAGAADCRQRKRG